MWLVCLVLSETGYALFTVACVMVCHCHFPHMRRGEFYIVSLSPSIVQKQKLTIVWSCWVGWEVIHLCTGSVWPRRLINICSAGLLPLVPCLFFFFYGGSTERGGAPLYTPQLLACKALSLSVSNGNHVGWKRYLPLLLVHVRFVPDLSRVFFYCLCMIKLWMLFVASILSSRGHRVGLL